MIQHTETKRCETNMSGSTAFTIQANAKMFKILSDGLYSNKEKAIIREISCNAYDANIAVGNEQTPIEIHLPNAIEPWFSVKDTGTGLCPEEMVNIYTQYGTSTKSDSNEFTGALGLGSKSPFSYTSSFTVESIKDGVKSTYTCYIDSNGEPQLQPFGSEETTEPNGVEVKLPINSEDFDKFKTESEIVFRPFKVKPNVTGNSPFEVKDYDILFESDKKEDWEFIEHIKKGWRTEKIQVAVQGNVEYPINTDKIYDKLSENAQKFMSNSFRLYFPIGDLDISASREELGYDKFTINNIVKKIEKMTSEIVNIQNEKVQEAESLFEARIIIGKIYSNIDALKNIKFTYNDEEISNIITISNDYKIIKYYADRYYDKIKREDMSRGYYLKKYSFSVKGESTYVYNDEKSKTKGVQKARSLVKDKGTVYYIEDMYTINKIGLTDKDYIKTSTIELDITTKTKSTTGKFYKKWHNTTYSEDEWYQTYNTNTYHGIENEEFYYIPLESKKGTSIKSLYDYAVILGYIKSNTTIYGVQKKHSGSKKFSEGKGINFVEFFKNKFKNDYKNELDNLKKSYESYTLKNNLPGIMYNIMTSDEDFSENSVFGKIKKEFDFKNIDNNISIKEKVFGRYYDVRLENNYYNFRTILFNNYSLLNSLSYNADTSDVIEYIKGIDILKDLNKKQEAANTTTNNIKKEA